MGNGESASEHLRQLGDTIREQYSQNRRVMSFAEYVDVVMRHPSRHLRSAPQYIRDVFDHFGDEEVQYPRGRVRRFKLFDCPWADGRDRLIGQEEVQNRLYSILDNFVREGTGNKLVLLHGPNGSAKSTIVRCIGRGMQHYSNLDDGCLYRFNWIFPNRQQVASGGIGFSGGDERSPRDDQSYAYLRDDLVDARLMDEQHDHPMFLIPAEKRTSMMREMLAGDESFVLSDYLRYGALSTKNRKIYEALLSSYQGDYTKVLRHVQVERFYVRHRYREGYATVEPQLAVDASERQVTMDRSVSSLPGALQSLSLHDYAGPVVEANRGLLEYSDLLKRPLEAYKYLLTTVERASVSLPQATLFLDIVFVGTSNEIHLSAFKEIPEFQSFMGRLELVRVPYLLDYQAEQQLYQAKLQEAARGRHVAPHCAFVAAMWAVLTRMRKPQAERYPKDVSDLVARLTPLEKAQLYAMAIVPDSLTSEQTKALTACIPSMWHESDTYPNYEGRTGASPREILGVVLDAASSSEYSYVSPLAILDRIEALTKQITVYEFLKQEALPGGFHAYRKFIDEVRECLVDRIDEDVRTSLGLIDEGEYERIFHRYVTHVMHWTKKEKIVNPTTGKSEEPDEATMSEVENILDVPTPADDFRHNLISRIGAWSLDNPDRKPDYLVIFVDYFKKLRQSYYNEQKKVVRQGIDELLVELVGDGASLEDEVEARARAARERLMASKGYTLESARDSVQLLQRTRYGDAK